jgi:hypothetical protein
MTSLKREGLRERCNNERCSVSILITLLASLIALPAAGTIR